MIERDKIPQDAQQHDMDAGTEFLPNGDTHDDPHEEVAQLRAEVARLREQLESVGMPATILSDVKAANLYPAAFEREITQLRDANERLLVAAVEAETRSEESERDKAHLSYAAHVDFLTNLPNRLLLSDLLAHGIGLASRHGNKLAVLFLDIDRFKEINDSFGHLVGDQLLQAVARRLVTAVRSSDTVSRLGGDEFVIVLADLSDAGTAALGAEKLRRALAAPHVVSSHELSVTVSVGISIYPDDGLDASSLIARADRAMYHAKAAGRDGHQLFHPNMENGDLSNRVLDAQRVEEGEGELSARKLGATETLRAATIPSPIELGQKNDASGESGEIAHRLRQLQRANEHLVVAAIRAHTLTEVNEGNFKRLVSEITDCAIYMLNVNGQVISWNKGAQRITGYTAEDTIGRHFSRFYPPDDVERGAPTNALETATREGHFEAEGWRVRNDGSRFWASIVIDSIRDEKGDLIGFAKLTRDLTERQEAHQVLKDRAGELQSLSHFLLSSVDNERAKIATELHDELGSQLIASNLDLLNLEESLRGSFPHLAQQFEEVRQGIITANSLNRQIMEELKPSILETLGLVPAIGSLCENYKERTGRECTFRFFGDALSSEANTSLTLYRITQEALSHLSGRGGEVSIDLRRTGGLIRLSVVDSDAHLLDYHRHAWPPAIAQMRERASLVGGSFDIKRDPTGTRAVIEAVIPAFARPP